ncbi:MAG TPA: hypothetical protein PLU49_08650 [Saprospiraceae bacterium]|nr:hypothetical protein [Saprospiraceae bacterium]
MSEHFSSVEKAMCCEFEKRFPVNISYVTVKNFPQLGLLTALRFLEWVAENPDGVISLPTGKTPEYFISWTKFILDNWDKPDGQTFRKDHGLLIDQKPSLKNLHFVQIDEFYPISLKQHNSFYHYVQKYYVEDFGLDKNKGLFINCDEINLAEDKHFDEIFPEGIVDLGLRYREPKTVLEKLQQRSIFMIDAWCTAYEDKIREKGGIGFFLGGIGPDGHIAFNTRGSDHNSVSRLTQTNYETQAVAAGDLGGIEVSRGKLVITIGLQTITYNPECVAIIFAAGEAKAPMVKDALEKQPSNMYPASVLTRLKNARFYLTTGAAAFLQDAVYHYYTSTPWNQEKTDRAVIDLCVRLDKFADHLDMDDLQNDPYCSLIPGLSLDIIQSVKDSILKKINRGTESLSHQMFYHTGPHHDDIMLGLLPHIHRLSRNETNRSHFAVMTSGFTAVTNDFLYHLLVHTRELLVKGLIQMVNYEDFFTVGYNFKRDKDVYHYLIRVATGNADERKRAFAHRMVRNITEIWKVKDVEELENKMVDVISTLRNSYDGEKLPPPIQRLKGMIREFEEELVWAYFGMTHKEVHHLRLGFYTGDIFTEKPDRKRDVEPILDQLRRIKPGIISLAFDPEGSGPDTHYKVLQAIAEAVRVWSRETDLEHLRIWGYRNVWYKFHPAEVSHIVPVSLNAMGVMDNAFTNSYLSQVDASFPSYQHDGKFSDLSNRIWGEQLYPIQLLLGKRFFYQNESPRLRTTHGLLFFHEMNVEEFLASARELEKSMEG